MNVMRALALLLFVIVLPAAAQDTPPPPPMDDAMMKYLEASTPNEHHKKLAPLIGGWDTESSFWADGPNNPPATGKGLANVAWALDGRFAGQELKGYFMGMPMRGHGYMGYDNLKKQYTMFWIDNTSTGMSTATGSIDAAGTTITLTGTYDDPYTGEKDKPAKYIVRMNPPAGWTFEMYDVPPNGPEVKTGEVVYKRATEHR